MKTTGTVNSFFSRYGYLAWFILLLTNCAITFYNGYPVLYSDTATYLSSGFELEAPADRPITYGLLLTLFSLGGLSLYSVPVFQSLIYLYVIKKLCELFFDKADVLKQVFMLSLLVSVVTGFNWCLNLLLPDFFTPLGFICLYCLLAGNRPLKQEWLLLLLFFISAASHIANVFSYGLVIVLAFVTQHLFFKQHLKKLFRIKLAIATGLLLLCYLIMGSAISKSKHVFMMGNLAQKGILQRVLHDSCGSSNFALCRYKDSIPRSFEYFVWNVNSPLYRLGGWKTTKPEFKKIIGISLSKPAYLRMHLSTSAQNFIAQLNTFGIGEGTGSFNQNTVLIQRIRHFVRLDAAHCLSTKQYQAAFINMQAINRFYYIAMVVALILFMLLVAFKFKSINRQLWPLLIFTVALIAGTSLLVAFTAEVSNRYGCRMAWLIVLLDFLMLRAVYGKKQSEGSHFST